MDEENPVELLQHYRRDRHVFLNYILSGNLIKKVVMTPVLSLWTMWISIKSVLITSSIALRKGIHLTLEMPSGFIMTALITHMPITQEMSKGSIYLQDLNILDQHQQENHPLSLPLYHHQLWYHHQLLNNHKLMCHHHLQTYQNHYHWTLPPRRN
uniref:Uncharacterized protein n=1 Tax=Triticum urartu TaxID=4572 RepID=A0A8R7PD76_TRIUA